MALNFSEFLDSFVDPDYQAEGKNPSCPKGYTWDKKLGACVPSTKTAKGNKGDQQLRHGAPYHTWGSHGLNGDPPALGVDDGGDSTDAGSFGEETDTSKWPSIKDEKKKKKTNVKHYKGLGIAPTIQEDVPYHRTAKDEKRMQDAERKHKEDDDRMRYGKGGKAPAELRPGEVKKWDKRLGRYVSNKE